MQRWKFEMKVGALVLSGFSLGLLVGSALPAIAPHRFDEVGAAWAQAILSAAAIGAAALIPGWHEKKRIRRRIDVLIGLISRAEADARELSEDLQLAVGAHFITLEPTEWEHTARLFDGIPQHDIPDTRMQWAISDSLRAVREVRRVFESIQQPNTIVLHTDYQWVKEQARVLDQCYEDAVRYSESWR